MTNNIQQNIPTLLTAIRACTICAAHLPLGPRPILAANTRAKILLCGQAPGIRVHQSGIPWNDPSGDRLRAWLGLSREDFYNEETIAIVPMGFCYPGTGPSGDLPPRPECAQNWHHQLLPLLLNIKLQLIIGQYACGYYLPETKGKTLTAIVSGWQTHLPTRCVLPHPSPRNQRWFKQNPWFEGEVVPALKAAVQSALAED